MTKIFSNLRSIKIFFSLNIMCIKKIELDYRPMPKKHLKDHYDFQKHYYSSLKSIRAYIKVK